MKNGKRKRKLTKPNRSEQIQKKKHGRKPNIHVRVLPSRRRLIFRAELQRLHAKVSGL